MKAWHPPKGAIKWKKGVPDVIYRCPRCTMQLKINKIYTPYEKMDDYLLAVSISERWSDKTLAATGKIDFWTMTGGDLLLAFEDILTNGIGGFAATGLARRYANKDGF